LTLPLFSGRCLAIGADAKSIVVTCSRVSHISSSAAAGG
jgi:hypothetical protein